VNEKQKHAPKQLKSLKLVRETLRELGTEGTTPADGLRPFTRGPRCTLSWAG